ncbi:nuclear factor related to kappa-B-binding protein [Trichonephila clavipes]|nr:nuclear factor related to kappa-B-binding protein [Trichonephila clavipes]
MEIHLYYKKIHTVVSGALDRLHYEKDPCVKYDVNRKLWIYLHRHRTEEEFERIHQAQAAAAKARKAVQKHKIPRFRNKEVVRTYTSAHVISNADNVALLNVDIPTVITTGQSHSPRGGTSPRTQCLRPQASLVLIYRPNVAGMKGRVDLELPVNRTQDLWCGSTMRTTTRPYLVKNKT